MFSAHQCLGILSIGCFLLIALQIATGLSFR